MPTAQQSCGDVDAVADSSDEYSSGVLNNNGITSRNSGIAGIGRVTGINNTESEVVDGTDNGSSSYNDAVNLSDVIEKLYNFSW